MPVGYTIFAVALGVAAGALVRKVLPAMTVTVAGFIGARVAVMVARPHFHPVHEARFPPSPRATRVGSPTCGS